MSYQPQWDGRSGYGGKRKHIILKIFLILVGLGMLCFGALQIVIAVNDGDQIIGEPKVMVVLGCQVKEDGPSILLQDRLDKALEYLEDHPDMTVVVAGGQGEDEPVSEAQAMYDYLTDHGAKGENILLEDRSHNTWQNVNNTADLLEEKGYDLSEPVLIVTNGFHLARAKWLWKRCTGTAAGGLSAPSSHFPTAVYMFFREPVGLVKSFVLDR